MQEFEDKLCIQRLVEMILNQFGDRTLSQNQPAQSEIPTETDPGNPSPKNTHQNQIHQAAISVSQTISHYNRHPLTTVPFCLQYPTYFDVLGYSIEQEKKYVFLPGNKMVVLVDEAGICVGVGVPPDKSNDKKSYLSHQDRALCSLNKMVLECRWNTSKQEINYSQTLSPGPLQTPCPLDMHSKGNIRDPKPKTNNTPAQPGAKRKGKTTITYQTYGYGLGDVQSTGMQDRKMKTNRHGIVASELQGHGPLGAISLRWNLILARLLLADTSLILLTFIRTGNNSSIYTLLPRSSSKSSSTSSPSRSFAHLQEYCLNQTHGTISLLSISLKLTPPTTQIQSRSSSTNSQSNNHNNSDHSSSRNYSSSNPIALFYLHQPIDIIELHIPLTPPFSTTSHHQSNIHHSNKRHHQQSRLSRTIYHPSGSPILQLSSINNTDENGGGHYKLLSNQKIDRLNLVIGIAYGFTSGTLSGICLLFAKTGVKAQLEQL
ncbi:hypothetical protein MJO28_015714 [Puccinia striiformis f. sp. tritici]|uniref:Uncharacterized protein n=1 Tax=Puccinia striiformis f. sp. tritici TaxID=168172 RepID=A0ACC0DQZ4_9BASI|nr:hypothetical protein MJO28_015714 [Puccinia striiformis f. sp. tritici]